MDTNISKPYYGNMNAKHFSSTGFLWRLSVMFVLFFIGFSSQSVAQIYAFKGDTLKVDQTWVKDTTYIIDQDLYVPKGIKLVIEAGVHVKINQGLGIIIDHGSLQVSGDNGTAVDSVFLIPNYFMTDEGWKWRGINFIGVQEQGVNFLKFAQIEDTETGIRIDSSRSVVIERCAIIDNQWSGIMVFNSNHCIINNCRISSGYLGIEMYASGLGNYSGYNLLNNCLISDQQSIGLKLWSRNRGLNTYNLISNTEFIDNNNGIQIDNGISVYGKNFLEKNVIKNKNKQLGYGIQLGQDSTEVRNNILWQNQIGIDLRNSQACYLTNNSFYENLSALIIGAGSSSDAFLHNTFSTNLAKNVIFQESNNIIYLNNNHFDKKITHNTVFNATDQPIDARSNYWGSTNENVIQQMIFDFFDNQTLGEVFYQPFFALPDTECPVSPPLGVIKQLVGDSIKVSWRANKELDLRNYKIYHGDFKNYSFENGFEIGNDSVSWINSVSIYDSIAVTALDNEANSSANQLLGFESPFAFATIAPFAGNDIKICENQDEIYLEESTAPFNYSDLRWITSGDGIFNEMVLHPVYTPGIIDRVSGEVVLTMSLKRNNIILKDELVLTLSDYPVVNIGNDTTIMNDEYLKLINTFADGYSEIRWISTGDGAFSDSSTIHPIYIPGTMDIAVEKVDLVLQAFSDCGNISDTITVYIKPFSSITGKLWYHGFSFNQAVVLAYLVNKTTTKLVSKTKPLVNGKFQFDRLLYGEYLIAAVPDTATGVAFVQTYYVDKINWQTAYTLVLTDTIYDIDLQMQETDIVLPIGVGSISGHFVKPAFSTAESDIYCSSWFTEKSLTYCDDGLSNASVFLYNQSHDKILDYTLTNESGDFIFRNLPFGNYLLDGDLPGYQTLNSPIFTLTTDNQSVVDVTFSIEDRKIAIIYHSEPIEKKFYVFPNPALDKITLFFENEIKNPVSIAIFTASGQRIIDKVYSVSEAENSHITLNINLLRDGLYIGKVYSNDSILGFSFVKFTP